MYLKSEGGFIVEYSFQGKSRIKKYNKNKALKSINQRIHSNFVGAVQRFIECPSENRVSWSAFFIVSLNGNSFLCVQNRQAA